jgi:hypothetical protein
MRIYYTNYIPPPVLVVRTTRGRVAPEVLLLSSGNDWGQRHGEENQAREYWRIFGVDLTAAPGINSKTVRVLLAEVGPDWSKFRSASALASWLGICPNNEISGGQVLSSKTRKVNNRAAVALRLAAHSLHHSHSYLGEYYRRMRTKLGAPKAIVATAHKLARILYHLITTRQEYRESVFEELENKSRLRAKAVWKLMLNNHRLKAVGLSCD